MAAALPFVQIAGVALAAYGAKRQADAQAAAAEQQNAAIARDQQARRDQDARRAAAESEANVAAAAEQEQLQSELGTPAQASGSLLTGTSGIQNSLIQSTNKPRTY
jgi:hypothetical protein